MRLLLDTHLLLWAAGTPKRLSASTRKMIESPDNRLFFSVASIWEVVIKRGLDRPDFQVDAPLLRRGLLDNGYAELAITGEHSLAVESLPPIHKDPFDRLLVAQATAEGMTLLTADANVSRYPGPIRKV
ncbi:type II toxin-antitoxin system VapC family toxin [Variovorax sp. JS1663]|uniref:type II toxin-antitoxin system VapC family toxin n=1 Tax=Variovorax sp. JS1663 TaxID=1851577 RepID=UPI000B345B8A|nr:type II toxin-antitoxin system VapC family toxin [Variovorax sp. JS1663]OUM00638.1 twitching motility protein PilT [Variovorax sp. JS1663]